MATSYYELLGVPATASPDEIKSAFRREIARYHPDKLQHLGDEFQSIAAIRSAELTEAYKTLTDGTKRANYDARFQSAVEQPPPSSAASAYAGTAAAAALPQWTPNDAIPDSPSPLESPTAVVRTGVSNLVKKAAMMRFREALHAEFGSCEEGAVSGFDIVCAPAKSKFWRAQPPRLYVRFVQYVDSATVTEAREMAGRAAHRDGREMCVFLLAPHVAPASELSTAITRETRRSRTGGVTLAIVPINTRSWSAPLPTAAPAAVRSLIARLKQS
jgi:curved DNA-binding protein CbpA